MADQTPPSIIVDYGPGLRVTVPRGASVLEASKHEGVAHAAACDGDARCSTCRVLVEEGAEHCPEPPAGESRAGAPIGWWAASPATTRMRFGFAGRSCAVGAPALTAGVCCRQQPHFEGGRR